MFSYQDVKLQISGDKAMLMAKNCYHEEKCVKAYDEAGKYIGNVWVKGDYKCETIEVGEYPCILQMGYKFYTFKSFGFTVDDFQRLSFSPIRNGYTTDGQNLFNYAVKGDDCFYNYIVNEGPKKCLAPEISITPRHSRAFCIVEKTDKHRLLSFNVEDYKNNFDEFVAKYPEHKDEAKLLFDLNIGVIARYYFTTPEKILNQSADLIAGSIKRLHQKINLNAKQR